MSSWTTYILGNWKMAQLNEEGLNFVRDIRSDLLEKARSQKILPGVFPSYVNLSALYSLGKKALMIGGQDCSSEKAGAFTGEVSAEMLREVGAEAVIIGHSERRQRFAESNSLLKSKLLRAEEASLLRVFCIGESLEQRKQGKLLETLRSQLEVLEDISTENLLVAYEPVWAIGTGLTPSREEIEEVHSWLASQIPGIPLLYGGSVKPENSKEILKISGVNGLLIGGASLKKESFESILQCAIECVDS